MSSLKRKFSKSCILVINFVENKVTTLTNLMFCEIGTSLLKYFDLPLGGNSRVVEFWLSITEKFESRLVGWKRGFFL